MIDPEVMNDRQLLDQLRYVEFLERLWRERRSSGGYIPPGVARDKAALEAEVEKRQRENREALPGPDTTTEGTIPQGGPSIGR